MAEQSPNPQEQISFLLADFNTRLRDSEERNRLIKERALLLGKNLISLRKEQSNEIAELKNQTNQIQKDVEKIKTLTQNILIETKKFVKRDEVMVVERMLKDFQPLEFTREKDVKALIKQALKPKSTKTIKTKKSIK